MEYIDKKFKVIIIITVTIITIKKGCYMAARKHSRQRELIKNFLTDRKDHPTADIIYTNVRRQNPNISLGTVYRNLTLLVQEGEINRLRLGDGVDHFDADTSPHYHFICTECGNVVDLEIDHPESIINAAATNFNGQITGHVAYFYGTCGNCLKCNHNL